MGVISGMSGAPIVPDNIALTTSPSSLSEASNHDNNDDNNNNNNNNNSNSNKTHKNNIIYNSIEDWLKANVNSVLQFHDRALAKEYRDFHTANNKNYVSMVSSTMFIAFFLLPYTIAFILSQFARPSEDDNHDPLQQQQQQLVYILWTVLVSGVFLTTGLYWFSYLLMSGWFKSWKIFVDLLKPIRRFAYVGIILCICLHFLLRVLNGSCQEEEDGWNEWICNPQAETGGLPADAVLLVTMAPKLVAVIMRDVKPKIQLVCWVISVGTLLFCGIYVGIQHTYLLMIIYLLGSSILVYDSKCYKLSLFYTYDNLRKTLAETERKADEVHANEMRHMIGNVAHDLKTPLSSFLSGIEFIIHVSSELKSKISHGHVISTEEINDTLHSITNCTKNMTSTNRFMLMAINRCIDYTKASKGLKLNPKYETIDLLEALNLPLNCMFDVQSSITIRLLPIPREICSHIITDKQWLQENVLCLLSNAVKYSSEGEVTISLTLHSENRTTGFLQKMKSIMVSKRVTDEIEPDDNTTVGRGDEYDEEQMKLTAAAVKYAAKEDAEPEKSRIKPPSSQNRDEISERGLKTSRLLPPERFVRIEIEDTGIGISEDTMSNLFSPFKQAQRMAGGTGLGLYSLAKRVEALKGHYGVSNRRDMKQGSLFWFEFPYRPDRFTASMTKSPVNTNIYQGSDHSDKNNLSKETSRIPGSSPITPTRIATSNNKPCSSAENSFHQPREEISPNNNYNNGCNSHYQLKIPEKKLNILLVDDSGSILKMTSMILKRGGHKITTAVNGADALQKVLNTIPGHSNNQGTNGEQSSFFDVIVMDLQMPVMDGLEATRRIRRLQSTGQVHSSKSFLEKNSIDSSTIIGNLVPTPPDMPPVIIIGCSANSDDETIEEAYNAGVDSFMAKPFSIDTFYQLYDEIIHEADAAEDPMHPEEENEPAVMSSGGSMIKPSTLKVSSTSSRIQSNKTKNKILSSKMLSQQLNRSRVFLELQDFTI